jgi:hypothetical protein
VTPPGYGQSPFPQRNNFFLKKIVLTKPAQKLWAMGSLQGKLRNPVLQVFEYASRTCALSSIPTPIADGRFTTTKIMLRNHAVNDQVVHHAANVVAQRL